MADTKVYPISVDDFIPFCIFVMAKNKTQAKKLVEEKYEWIKDCANIEYLSPININEGTIFALDVEMCILKDSVELYKWLCPDEDGFYADGFRTKPEEIVEVEVKKDGKNTEESKEDNDDDTSESDSEKSDESKYTWL